MSRHGDVTLEWADGEYSFRLPLGELRRLQEKCDAGPHELMDRLLSHRWRIDDIRETIRLGLIGGGSVKTEAGATDDRRINRLIAEYVDNRPKLPSVMVAAQILNAELSGAADEPIPKSTAAEVMPQGLSEASSPSPQSTDGARALDTHPGKSTNSRSGSSVPASPASKPPTGRRKNSNRQPETSSIR